MEDKRGQEKGPGKGATRRSQERGSRKGARKQGQEKGPGNGIAWGGKGTIII